eukprot:264808-Pleurochrysis_carterae.AAC.3
MIDVQDRWPNSLRLHGLPSLDGAFPYTSAWPRSQVGPFAVLQNPAGASGAERADLDEGGGDEVALVHNSSRIGSWQLC